MLGHYSQAYSSLASLSRHFSKHGYGGEHSAALPLTYEGVNFLNEDDEWGGLRVACLVPEDFAEEMSYADVSK